MNRKPKNQETAEEFEEECNRHAPAGFKIVLQYGYKENHWSEAAILKSAAKLLTSQRRTYQPQDLRAVRGHFSTGDIIGVDSGNTDDWQDEHEPRFHPVGWMVFEPEDW